MITIYSTGDRESDLVLWNRFRKENHDKLEKVVSVNCSEESDLNLLLSTLETVSFFANDNTIICHNVPYSTKLAKLLDNATQDVYIVTMTGRWGNFKKNHKLISEQITDQVIKTNALQLLKEKGLPTDSETLAKIYSSISVKHPSGKTILSPLIAETFLRRIQAIDSTEKNYKESFTAVLRHTNEHVNQWQMLDYLFLEDKMKQHEYFSILTSTVSPFELIAQIKSTLFLSLALLKGSENGLGPKSMATKLKKHPFYITSLFRTVTAKKVNSKKIFSLITRFMRLENALKAGDFEDEKFGFEILLVTI